MKLFKFKDPNTGGTRYCDIHGKLYGTDRSITRRRNKRFSENNDYYK